MTTSKRSFVEQLWDFFCSLRLSIFLLIILAVTSIIGTVVPQNAPMEENLKRFSEGTISLFNSLNLFDMYHSWWFILLLYLLTVNLIACSVKRLPRVWRIVSHPTLVMDEGLEKSLPNIHEFKVDGALDAEKQRLQDFLSTNFAPATVSEVDGAYHLFAQKGAWSRLGVYVVHLSIVIIFIGGIIGSLFGYKAFVNILEGTGTSTVYTRTEKAIDLGFTVKCEKFSVSFYDTGAPKEFRSVLTVIDNGKNVIESRPIIVNDPLTYKGITFYQSSYGAAGDPIFYISARPRSGGDTLRFKVRQGEKITLPGGASFSVTDSTPEVRQFMPGFSGPAARIQMDMPGKTPEHFLVFRQAPDFDAQRGGAYIFTYDNSEEKMYTGLQVAKDPGVWVVWTGCLLMVIGTCMAFFMSHKRIWIRIGGGKAVFAGSASKNQAGFSLQFQDLVDQLKTK